MPNSLISNSGSSCQFCRILCSRGFLYSVPTGVDFGLRILVSGKRLSKRGRGHFSVEIAGLSHITFGEIFFACLFVRGFCYLAQAGLKLMSLPPQHAPLHLALMSFHCKAVTDMRSGDLELSHQLLTSGKAN